jgi:hypothetical protein
MAQNLVNIESQIRSVGPYCIVKGGLPPPPRIPNLAGDTFELAAKIQAAILRICAREVRLEHNVLRHLSDQGSSDRTALLLKVVLTGEINVNKAGGSRGDSVYLNESTECAHFDAGNEDGPMVFARIV